MKKFEEVSKEIFEPCIKGLREMDEMARAELRKKSSISMRMDTARLLATWINDVKEGFGSEILKDWEPRPDLPEDSNLRDLTEFTEQALRSMIPSKLEEEHGKGWYKKCVPGDIKDYINREINKRIEKAPHSKEEFETLPDREKLQFTTLGHLIQLILKKENWKSCFEKLFRDQKNTNSRLNNFKELRDAVSHFRYIDDESKQIGYHSMIWLRKSLRLK